MKSARYALATATTAALVAAFGSAAQASSATIGSWNIPLSGGAATGNWSGTPANWSGGVPSVAGDIAFLNDSITAGSVVTLNANISLGTLNFGPTPASYNVAGPGILTFDSGTSGVAAQLTTLDGNLTSNDFISAPIVLNSNLNVTQGDLKIGTITLGGGINGSNNAINLHSQGVYGGAGAYILSITGPVSNVSAIRNLYGTSDTVNSGSAGFTLQVSGTISNGSSNLELDSYGDSGLLVSGVITTSGGLTINGPSMLQSESTILSNSLTGEVDLTGANAITGATIVNSAFLFLDYSKTGGNNSKIDAASALNLNSSYLQLNSNTSTASVQVVKGLVVGGGASEIKLTNNSQGMTFNTTGGTAALISRATSSYATLDFNNANASSQILYAANTNTNGIQPAWMTWGGSDWATVNGSGQIVQYTGYNTSNPTSGSVGVTDSLNFQYSGGASTGALPINSMKVTSGSTFSLGGNLTLTSGGLLTNTASSVIFNGGSPIVAGASGTGELVLQTENNTGLLLINTPITASSLTKSGAGEAYLNTSSALPTGQVTINQGTLTLGSGVGVSGNNFALNSGGALGMTGSFTGNIGTGNGQVQFGTGGGGFSAVGGPLTVNINGNAGTITSTQLNGTLVLNNLAATAPITLVNPININSAGLTISVGNSGSLSGQGNTATNLGNNGYAYSVVGAISGNGDLRVQGTPNGVNPVAIPSGLLVPTGALTYTGVTEVSGATLYATPNAASIPANTTLELSNNGVLGTSGTFNRSFGAGPGQVTLGGYAGFAAIGGPLNVLLGNSTAEAFSPGSRNEFLTLGSPFAGNSVNYENNITNTTTIASSGPVVNVVSGVISGSGTFTAGGGQGILYLPGVNTFTGTWAIGNADALLRIGSGNNSSTGSLDSSLGLAGSPLTTGASGWNISSGGSGYTNGNGQTLTINSPTAGGTAAVATYNVSGNAVTAFAITTAGNGFYNAPSITIPGGSGATIVASNAAAWFGGNTVAGGLDLNGTTTSEPMSLATNKSSEIAGNIVNSNTASAATINGDLFLGTGGFLSAFGGPGNIVVNGDVYGNVGPSADFFKFGAGTLTLNGTNYEGGAGSTGSALNLEFNLYGGTVVLNYGTNNTNKIGANGTGYLELENVNLKLNGSSSSTTTQTVGGSGGTKLFLGGNTISVVANGSQNTTLNLGPISRLVNGTTITTGSADFQTTAGSGGGVATITTSTNNISGILPPTLVNGGSYTAAPTVTFSTPTSGTAATGVAIWNSSTGAVTGIIITNPGAGYTAAPTISFTGAGTGGASATGNFGSYGYLGGWATFGGGASFATGATGGVNTSIGAVANSSYGTVVAPGKLLDVGTGNGTGGGTTFTDAVGNTYGANGIGDYTSGGLNSANIGATVAAIRFNSFSNAGSPNTLQLATIGGGNPTLFIGDCNNDVAANQTGDAAGGIIDTANTGNASNGAPSVITGGQIAFGANGTFFISQYNTAQPLQIQSVVNQYSSGETLVKTGPGELQFTNTVNSGIAVFGGMVTASSPAAMGASITLGSGTTFKYAAINTSTGFVGGNSGNFTGKVTLNGPATFDNESGNQLSFTTSGNDFSVNSSAPWDLTITGNAGGDIILTGGISLGATYASAYGGPTQSTITPGFGQLIKNGANNLVIGGTSVISGGVIINNGAIVLGNATQTLPNDEPITINANASAGTLGILEIGGYCFNAVGPITLNGGSITGNTTGEGSYGSGTGTLSAMAYNFNAGTASVNLAGIVGVYKATAGTVILSGSNTFTGPTILNAGVLNLGSAETPGVSGPLGEPPMLANSLQMNGGTLQYSSANQYDYSNRFGTGPNLQYNVDTNGQNVTWNSSLTSVGGSLLLNDSNTSTGILTLKGSNTYSGPTVVTAGTLYAGSATALSPNSAFNISGGSVNASGGTLDASGFNTSIASLVMGTYGNLNLGSSTLLTDTGTAVFAGTFNLIGTPSSLPDVVMTYNSHTGTFANLNVPAGDTVKYLSNALEIVVGGTSSLIWNNAAATGTWNTTDANWNNGSGNVTYNDTSNTSTGDIVTFNDNNGGSGNYSVIISGVVHPTSVTFANNNGNYVLTGANSSSGISGTTGVTLNGTATVTLSSSNTYTGGTNINAGKLVLASATAFPSGIANAGTGLMVASGATLQIANHGSGMAWTPITSSFSNAGTIDLTNNAMILRGSSSNFGAINAQVVAAYNSGNWNGSSGSGVITSTMAAGDPKHLTAVGIATGLNTTFEGVSVTPSDVLLKYTYYGDANLDGHVDSSDYTLIDAGYLSGGTMTGWQNGDFNYDGVINGSDYTLIDNAFNTQGAGLSAQIASPTAQIGGGTASAVPEPTSLGLLAVGAAGLLGRRRRK